jgi:catechol 2,3-dioxygenase-like lactoylglutathione lyase family enzyme
MNIEINHILVRTKELNSTCCFLVKALGLVKGYRPPFNFSGAWLYGNGKPLIHLIEVSSNDESLADYLGSNTSNSDVGIGAVDHIAFMGFDYPDLIKRLKSEQVKYCERTVPLTNEHQVFVDAPDGLKIELMFNLDKSPINTNI